VTPHIAGRVAFVTGARAISYAESIMSIVEHYHLGLLVQVSQSDQEPSTRSASR